MSRSRRSELHARGSLSVHPYSEWERKSPVPSIQWAWCACEWENKQQTTNSTSYIFVQLERFSPLSRVRRLSLARSVYSESCWAQRTRPIITKWRAAALQIYIHSTVPHAFNIDGPASSEDFRVILLLLCVFLFVKWAEGRSSVRDGWESRHPRRSCGDMWVFAALCSSMSQCCVFYVYSNSDAEYCQLLISNSLVAIY